MLPFKAGAIGKQKGSNERQADKIKCHLALQLYKLRLVFPCRLDASTVECVMPAAAHTKNRIRFEEDGE